MISNGLWLATRWLRRTCCCGGSAACACASPAPHMPPPAPADRSLNSEYSCAPPPPLG